MGSGANRLSGVAARQNQGGCQMERRKFIKTAAVGGMAVAAASALPAPAISQGLMRWKLAMSWPLNSPGLGTSGQRVARRITALSGGKNGRAGAPGAWPQWPGRILITGVIRRGFRVRTADLE